MFENVKNIRSQGRIFIEDFGMELPLYEMTREAGTTCRYGESCFECPLPDCRAEHAERYNILPIDRDRSEADRRKAK